ncbi:hypothetical protein FGO68_gene7389 [Halteria grandinella]|uniref:PHD-type domain-containing protein n=1 Tax=Halteria grandinella TaxID=5974 RepID=A0A8J8P7H1_HALGN|nr:hypothetical protein FGO68_gene7389 [Halteria grandinella]
MSSSTKGGTKLQDQVTPTPPTLSQKESECWCPICLKRLQGGVKSVIQCVQCKNGVHYECGLPLFKDIKKNTSNWICDMCKAKKNTTPKGKRGIEDRRCIICRESTTKDYGLYKECENIINSYKGQQFVHLRCQRWHPEIKVSSDCMLYSTNKFKGIGRNSIDEEESCFVCKKVSDEILCRCMVNDCTSKHSFFHPTCLASQVPLSDYTLILYKR